MSATAELWRPVVERPAYEVSDTGRVRSTDRTITDALGRIRRLRSVELSVRNSPYPTVDLYVGSERITRAVHVLMLCAFVGPPGPGQEACHQNGDLADCRLTNLRWDTHAENNRDIVRHGHNRLSQRTHCLRGHELAGANLSPRRLPRRDCLACCRGRSEARRLGAPERLRELADAQYRRIRGAS